MTSRRDFFKVGAAGMGAAALGAFPFPEPTLGAPAIRRQPECRKSIANIYPARHFVTLAVTSGRERLWKRSKDRFRFSDLAHSPFGIGLAISRSADRRMRW